MNRMKEIQLSDVYDNPNEYGLPTFEEYAKNPEKWIGRDDDILSSASQGGYKVKDLYQRHIYEIEGYRCKSLEEVERVARNQGIKLKELDYRPQMIPQGGGKWDILIKFVSKNERARRNDIRS